MPDPSPVLDPRYGDPDADATSWQDARARLEGAELSWITTVRPNGRPHVTPLLTVWHGGAVHFCTGPEERKHKNLEVNPHVALTTGTNTQQPGELDLVVEGQAVRVSDRETLRLLAEAWVAKYGEGWRFDVGDDSFLHPGGNGAVHVFRVVATTVFAFGKNPFSQTRFDCTGS
jgi:general stress protein 26